MSFAHQKVGRESSSRQGKGLDQEVDSQSLSDHYYYDTKPLFKTDSQPKKIKNQKSGISENRNDRHYSSTSSIP